MEYKYTFILISALLVLFSYTQSTKSTFAKQAVLHVISIAFCYIWLFPRKVKPVHNYADKKMTHADKNMEKTIEQRVLTKDKLGCLRSQCSKAATLKECDKYARCKWTGDEFNGTCSAKAKQCEDIKTARNCNDECSWNDVKHTCSWNHDMFQSPRKDIHDHKIINEKSRLNRYCFKDDKRYDLDDNANVYIEDLDHKKCLDDGDPEETCVRKSKMKLACNSTEGNVFNYRKSRCTSMKVKQPCVPPHEHGVGELPYKATPGSRPAHTFQIREDKLLRGLFNTLLVLTVLLANAGVIRMFKK
jgi:hypothetical protein